MDRKTYIERVGGVRERKMKIGTILHTKNGHEFSICHKTKVYEKRKKLPNCKGFTGHKRYYPHREMGMI